MPLNSRKVCRCYPWNTEHLTESSRLSSWLCFFNISGKSSQTLVFIIWPAQFILPHYNLIMTHSTQCHYCNSPPLPHDPLPYLRAAHDRANRSMSSHYVPNPGAARPEMWACGLSLARTAGSNPAGCMDVFLW
jgi:hypothetical protein